MSHKLNILITNTWKLIRIIIRNFSSCIKFAHFEHNLNLEIFNAWCIEICHLTTKWHLWRLVYVTRGWYKKKEIQMRGGERTRPPSRDMSGMCADETGRCAKPGFDRHLSSYQHARRNCSDPVPVPVPVPVPRSSPASHKCENYIRGLSQAAALSPRVIHDRTALDLWV